MARLDASAISFASKGIEDVAIQHSVNVNPLTGVAVISVPPPLTPGRSGFSPSLALEYTFQRAVERMQRANAEAAEMISGREGTPENPPIMRTRPSRPPRDTPEGIPTPPVSDPDIDAETPDADIEITVEHHQEEAAEGIPTEPTSDPDVDPTPGVEIRGRSRAVQSAPLGNDGGRNRAA